MKAVFEFLVDRPEKSPLPPCKFLASQSTPCIVSVFPRSSPTVKNPLIHRKLCPFLSNSFV